MRTVYKYPIKIVDGPQMLMVKGVYSADFLHAGFDPRGVPCVWALVDTEQPERSVDICVFGTGHPVENTGAFVGTFIDGQFVWHVFAGPIPF